MRAIVVSLLVVGAIVAQAAEQKKNIARCTLTKKAKEAVDPPVVIEVFQGFKTVAEGAVVLTTKDDFHRTPILVDARFDKAPPTEQNPFLTVKYKYEKLTAAGFVAVPTTLTIDLRKVEEIKVPSDMGKVEKKAQAPAIFVEDARPTEISDYLCLFKEN